MPKISIIVATDRGGAIGRKGDLIYHISADLRHFKMLTMGHPIIMGRLTFDSLPNGALPGRRNMVISRSAGEAVASNVEYFKSIDAAVDALLPDDEAFVIGGGQIYAAMTDMADSIYLTEIDADAPADADAFFPRIDANGWRMSECGEWETDQRSGLRYRFICLSRI